MEITTTAKGDVNIVGMKGKFDTQTSPDAEVKLMDLIQTGATKIVINFDGLEFISSAGLRVLLVAAKKMSELGGTLRICSINEVVRDVFEISGFDTILEVTEDEAAALDGL
jgi:stage II sporulation protein AA (anti-sigma F factor antagonist)